MQSRDQSRTNLESFNVIRVQVHSGERELQCINPYHYEKSKGLYNYPFDMKRKRKLSAQSSSDRFGGKHIKQEAGDETTMSTTTTTTTTGMIFTPAIIKIPIIKPEPGIVPLRTRKFKKKQPWLRKITSSSSSSKETSSSYRWIRISYYEGMKKLACSAEIENSNINISFGGQGQHRSDKVKTECEIFSIKSIVNPNRIIKHILFRNNIKSGNGLYESFI